MKISLVGTYHNGCVKFDKEVVSEKPVEVTVTFLEDVEVKEVIKGREDENKETKPEKRLRFEDFNFAKSREILKDIKTSLSDAVIEERRGDGL